MLTVSIKKAKTDWIKNILKNKFQTTRNHEEHIIWTPGINLQITLRGKKEIK